MANMYSQDLSSYFLEAEEGASVVPVSYRTERGLVERPTPQNPQQEETSDYEPLGFLDTFVGYAQATYDNAVNVFKAPSSDRATTQNGVTDQYLSTLESAPAVQSSIEKLSGSDVEYDDSWLSTIENTPDPMSGLREGYMNRQGDTAAFRVSGSSENADVFPNISNPAQLDIPEPKSYDSPYDMSDLEILARTIHAEAKGEPYEGKVAVGAVMANRLASGSYGSSGGLKGVILKKSQFSPWNSWTGGANGRQGKDMLGLSAKPDDAAYRAAKSILSGNYTDPTKGATHYVNESIAEGQSWIKTMKDRKRGTLTLGRHLFGNADSNKLYDGKAAITKLYGGAIGPSTSPTGLDIKKATRSEVKPTPEKLNISLDFNSITPTKGKATGTEVIIPDNASPAVKEAAERFNSLVVSFAEKHGYEGYKNRGVKTRSENKRGVANTIHVEPFFTQDAKMEALIKQNPQEFAKLYSEAFGGLSATLVAPHGDRDSKGAVNTGATSKTFGNELAYGNMILDILLSNSKR